VAGSERCGERTHGWRNDGTKAKIRLHEESGAGRSCGAVRRLFALGYTGDFASYSVIAETFRNRKKTGKINI